MADNTIQKALINVALVVLTDKDDNKLSFTTSTKANIKVEVEEGKKTELIIKGILKAQRKLDAAIKGVSIEFEDNMFQPQVVALLQGGVVVMDAQEKFVSYSAPLAGAAPDLEYFGVDIYTEETDTSGVILGYAKLSLPNGRGEPIELGFEDDKFFATKYTINTAPMKGEAPYTIEMVTELPLVA